MRDYQQINAIIREVEGSFPVNSLMYGDVPLWPLIRQDLARILFWEDAGRPDAAALSSALRSIPALPARMAHAVADRVAASMMHDRLAGTSDVLFLTAGFEYVSLAGAFYNKFLDPVKELLDARGVSHADVEFGFDGTEYAPKHARTIDLRRIVGLLSEVARIGTPGFTRRQRRAVADFAARCAADFRLAIDVRQVLERAARIATLARTFGRVVAAKRPKVCMFVCYYQDAIMAMAHACRRLGVTTVEIQHSVLSEYEWSWCKWGAIEGAGYSTMPDVFWSWGERYSMMLDCWRRHPGTNLYPRVGGNLWIWKWRRTEDNAVPESTARLRAAGRTILYTVPFGDSKLMNEWFPAELEEAIRSAPADWRWHVRLHYKADDALVESVRRHAEALGPNVRVHHAREHHLYHLFSVVDVHLAQTGTTVVEAESFGVPNIILGEVGRAWYRSEIDAGEYAYARTGAELLELVRAPSPKLRGTALSQPRLITDSSCAEALLDELNLLGESDQCRGRRS